MNGSWENMKQECYDDDDNSLDCTNDGEDDDLNNDAEGVWSPDIEQSFQEALAIYPPCGRRKIILSEEGKMYGRNELIARYIKLRTGKTRTRKQVSSHIQVLAKRKTKDFHGNPITTCSSSSSMCKDSLNKTSSSSLSTNSTILTQNKSFLNFANQPPQTPTSSTATPTTTLSSGTTHFVPTATSIWSHPGLSSTNSLQPNLTSPPPQPHSTTVNLLASSTSSTSSTSNSSCNHDSLILNHFGGNQTWSPLKHIGSSRLRLIEFSGFLEQRRDPDLYHKHLFVHLNPLDNLASHVGSNDTHGDFYEAISIKEFVDKFPESDLCVSETRQESFFLIKFWVDLNYALQDTNNNNTINGNSNGSINTTSSGSSSSSSSSCTNGNNTNNNLYAVNNIFESDEPMIISVSTKVCSFGNQVVEKVESEQSRYENGRYVYRIENSPMCEYMITFINKLKALPEKNHKNSVLENFSVLQLIKNHDTQELLLSLAYVFEVSTSEHGAQHVIYRLINK